MSPDDRPEDRPPVSHEAPLRVVSGTSGDLEAIVRLLAASRDVRTELVDDIRGQMSDGAYMSPEKLNLAIYRMLQDVLA